MAVVFDYYCFAGYGVKIVVTLTSEIFCSPRLQDVTSQKTALLTDSFYENEIKFISLFYYYMAP